MNSTRYQNLMQYILPLMAVSSLISQSLVDLFLIICGMHWIYFFVKEKTRKEFLPYTGLEWAFLGLFISMLLSILVNYWGQWYYLWPLHKIKWVLDFYVILWFLRRYGVDFKKLVKVILVIGLIPSVYSIATYFYGIDFINPDRITSDRVVGLVNSATYHSHAGALLAGLSLFLLLQIEIESRAKKLFLFLLGFIFVSSVYLAFTRGALLALLIGGIVYLYFSDKKKLIYFMVILSCLSPILYYTNGSLQKRVQETGFSGGGDKSRLGLFIAYKRVFQDHWVFGSGYDAYKLSGSHLEYTRKENVPEDLQISHAHNQYLQLAATTGIFGILSFIYLVCKVLIINRFWADQNQSSSKINLALGSTFLVAMLLMVTDQTFEYAKLRALIIYIMALIVYCKKFAFRSSNLE